MLSKTTRVVQTDVESKDGQDKCPKCGATDISLNSNNGLLRCNYCRHEFSPNKLTGMATDISQLHGQVIGSGAQNIVASSNDVVTFKCSSCGAEVVIDTASSSQAKCHWCRNILSVNQQIPNGSIPDAVLPFQITKDAAKIQIANFVGKRKFFAHPKFKQEFTTENIMGVYFPYMVVDINAHAKFYGKGEHLVREYTRGTGERAKTYYDADLYEVGREFDIAIYGLTIESNSERLKNSSNQTNNIINAIMPFDIENCVRYNANYLKGYTSERRDTNIDELKETVSIQSKDIARISTNNTLKEYDRGVAWQQEQFEIKGEQWKAAYLPVWLYSYQQVSGNKKVLHYVAVNARTKETMGSIPIHMPKLVMISFLVELIGLITVLYVDFEYDWIFLLSGIIYFILMYSKYRNVNARHTYEKDTEVKMENLQKIDQLLKHKTGLSDSSMNGANNTNVNGQNARNFIAKRM